MATSPLHTNKPADTTPASRTISRRSLLAGSVLAAGATIGVLGEREAAAGVDWNAAPSPGAIPRRQPIGVSTYSFWQFKPDQKLSIEECIQKSSAYGFDGVEILHRQMTDESPAGIRSIKQCALKEGMPLFGLSTHQTFVSPKPEVRRKNIDHTIHCLQLAHDLGIPTIRVNTGTWGTRKDFDDLMAHRGIEEVLEGHTEDEGFQWVNDSFAECVVAAEKLGVVMGLENHWGLGRTATGVLRVIKAVNSPWLKATVDTGNFLDDQYTQFEQLLPQAVLIQAKTYYGGGNWYTLDLDYTKYAQLIQAAGYRGYVSLEFEGKAPAAIAIPQSLAMLRSAFAG